MKTTTLDQLKPEQVSASTRYREAGMEKTNMTSFVLVAFGAFFWLVPSVGAQVDCDKDQPGSLQKAIDKASPGETILVTGSCNENVTIAEGKYQITLDGGGQATITGPDTASDTLSITGRGVSIRGFTITGGLDGISVGRGGNATIDGNTTQGSRRFGISVNQTGFAVIVNNTIQGNPESGISVAGNSFAFIGYRAPGDTVASPNIIQNNGVGIDVTRSAAARISGNDISNNARHGVRVQRGAQADISDNTINGNGQNGIQVIGSSGVMLGANTGDTLLTRPNITTILNVLFGIRCEVGGSADGRLGSLNGGSGAQSYLEGCVGSLIAP